MIISRCVFCLVIFFGSATACCAQQQSFYFATAGAAKAAIVINKDAPAAEQTAAKELADHLKQITGVEFPIYSLTTSPAGMPRILIGQSEETRRLLGNIDWKSLKFDGIAIQFVGNDLILAGDRPRGSLYAVYTFLEEYIGCRWWTPKASFIPQKCNLSVKRINKTHIPPFMYREAYFTQVTNKNPEFAARLKQNGTVQSIPEEFGSHYTLMGFVHTANNFMPAAAYFDTHPEWFSLVNGKRVGGQAGGQLCLTNEEMKAEFLRNVMVNIDADPFTGMVAIDQNDNLNYCQCEKCTAVANEEGGQSGVMLRFVNSIADEIAKKYPDFLIETLAYQYTRHAPKLTKPRDNVIVRLCSIECDVASPLNSKKNASFYNDLQAWKKISKHLYIWDYVVNFQNLTVGHPNWRVLGPNMRIFADNNVVGMFSQGDTYNNDAAFGNMKTWVLSCLMWDPTLDAHKLMKEFAAGYYGPASRYMIDYLDLTCDAIDNSYTLALSCFAGSYFDYLQQKEMDKANELFDRAERSVVNNSTLLNRVRIERLALDHTWILQTMLDRSKAGKARNMDMKAVTENFISMSEATGNNYISEGIKMSADYYNTLRSQAVIPQLPKLPTPPTRKNAVKPAAVAGLKANRWVDMQDSKMFLYQPGVKSFIVADEEASDGRAIRLPGSQYDWAAQVHLDKTGIKPGETATIYVSVKAKIKASSGVAFTIAIIDVLANNYITKRDIMIEDIKDSKYHDYNLGTYKLEPKWYVYVASPGNDRLVDEVLVDRGFVIKDN